jgi:hypothetical protein
MLIGWLSTVGENTNNGKKISSRRQITPVDWDQKCKRATFISPTLVVVIRLPFTFYFSQMDLQS